MDEVVAPTVQVEDAPKEQEVRRLPEDFSCLWCGYDVRGATVWKCPECGRDFDEVDFKTHALRQFASARAIRRFVVWDIVLTVVATGVLLTVALSRLIFLWPWGPVLFLATLFAVLLTASGGLSCLFAPSGLRRLYLWVWLKVLGKLHTPWLVVGAGAIVFILAAYVVHALDVDKLAKAIMGAMYFGGILWLPIAWSTLRGWTARVREVEHDLGLLPSGFRVLLLSLGWATLGCTLVMGGVGGFMTFAWVAYILHS